MPILLLPVNELVSASEPIAVLLLRFPPAPARTAWPIAVLLLPIELKYLPIVESAFNPIAVSRVGATGLWQMMYGTGAMMGLKINSYIDERRDPVLATEAAAKYLQMLYNMYGDWHLVLAAYNSGPGNVNKAIARAGGVKNFWAIMNYLPAETRSYVPTYIAAVYVMNNYKDYKLVSSEPRRELYAVDTVLITSKVSLKHICNHLSIPEDELQFLNPSVKTGIIPYTENGFALNLPVNYFALFEARKEEVIVEVSMQYNDGYSETVFSFANNINTVDGGTHLSGFRSALTRTINYYAGSFGLLREQKDQISITGDDVREGLTAVVSVRLPQPQSCHHLRHRLQRSQVGPFRLI